MIFLTPHTDGLPQTVDKDFLELPGNALFVSPDYTEVEGSPYYNVIQHAIDAANGETIFVFPGVYDEKISLATNIRMHFFEGAVLTPSTEDSSAVVDVNNCSNVTITGDLIIDYDSGTTSCYILTVRGSGSNIFIRVQDIIAEGSASAIKVDGSTESVIEFDELNGFVYIRSARCRLSGDKLNNTLEVSVSYYPDEWVYAEIAYLKKLINSAGNLKLYFSDIINSSANVYAVEVTAGYAWLIDGHINATGTGYSAIRVTNGAKIRLQHVKVTTTVTGVFLAASYGIIDNCCFVVGPAYYSVDGNGGAWLKNWGSVGNYDVNTVFFVYNTNYYIQALIPNTQVE